MLQVAKRHQFERRLTDRAEEEPVGVDWETRRGEDSKARRREETKQRILRE